jgi:hypothetical protein
MAVLAFNQQVPLITSYAGNYSPGAYTAVPGAQPGQPAGPPLSLPPIPGVIPTAPAPTASVPSSGGGPVATGGGTSNTNFSLGGCCQPSVGVLPATVPPSSTGLVATTQKPAALVAATKPGQIVNSIKTAVSQDWLWLLVAAAVGYMVGKNK